eukprot:CAMPEP_0117684152 /NCGR_PEP_ID=MMETSP0804-20121206/20901_1 /TAXON_ID=1074897 /ORGANISM="Tetraselmis astigmatica, Strain CCMP880" /LENGTH=40 /DNA_ID= /DNA_START= /DNA_END= /DNA_ORIENTATION=
MHAQRVRRRAAPRPAPMAMAMSMAKSLVSRGAGGDGGIGG